MIYFLILSILGLSVFVFDVNGINKGKRGVYFIIFVTLSMLMGLRYRLGLDSIHYLEDYESLPTFSDVLEFGIPITRYGVGWVVLVSFVKEISTDFTFLQLCLSFFINWTIFWYFKKNTKFIFTAVFFYSLFYYFYFNTEILRESVAVCIFIRALVFFKKDKWLKYYTIITFALLFHNSAIICFLFPLVRILKLKRYFYLKLLFIFTAFSIFWLNFAQSLLMSFFSGTEIQSRMDIYLGNEFIYNLNGLIFVFIAFIVLPYYILSRYKTYLLKYNLGYDLVVVCLFLGFMIGFNSVIFQRFFNYLIIPLIAIIVNILELEYASANYMFKRNKIFLLLLIFMLPRFYSYFRIEYDELYFYERYFPYTTVLEKKEIYNREKIYDYSKEY